MQGVIILEFKEIKSLIESKRNLSEIDIEEITKEGGIAESLGYQWRNNLDPTQLRKFFDTIKGNRLLLKERGWDAIKADFYMLRPTLAYSKARGVIPEEFYSFINICIQKIVSDSEEETRKNYETFVKLLESIVAYHKYFRKR